MNTQKIKKIILGEIGAGVLLMIIQFIVGFNFDGDIFYIIGYNFIFLLGIASIIDGIRKLKK